MRRALLPALALLLAASCKGGDSSPQRRTLVDSRDDYDPRSLDPALSTDVPTGRAVGYLFDGLLRFTPDAKVESGLEERWEVSPDGKVYTFHLRRGVAFHDGTPFVASHVVSSFQRVLDPAQRGGRGWPLYPIAGARAFTDGKAKSVSGLAAPNDSTLVVTLAEPLAIFPKLLAMPVASIVPPSAGADFGERPVGTGPWKLVEWRHDDYIRFAANKQYWGGAPKADSLTARIIPEGSTKVAEFESGNVDVLLVPEADSRRWSQTDESQATLTSVPALRFIHMSINTRRGPLADARVRRAINQAVDTRGILQRLVSGRGRVAAGVIPPILAGADTTRAPYTYDPAAAKRLLAEAGHPNGIDVELWTSTTPIFVRMAETIQSYLNAVNIRTKIVQRESASAREAARKGDVDLFIREWYADYPDPENFLFPLLHSQNAGVGGNYSFYANPAFDRIVDASRREQDDARRVALYQQADSIAFHDAPVLFLFFYNDLYAIQPWVSGFVPPTIFNGQTWGGVEIKAGAR
jgi:peptide/nickel transport system substrate-binding protein/oligopeptide transport system substrate-binding protein